MPKAWEFKDQLFGTYLFSFYTACFNIWIYNIVEKTMLIDQDIYDSINIIIDK